MSDIFFSKISVIDHARLTSLGPVGGSYNLSAIASLPAEDMSDEQVVVDFSSGKKWLKDKIDAHTDDAATNGFDHKLWVPDNVDVSISDSHATVQDEFVRVSGPLDMFKFVDIQRSRMNHMDTLATEMENFVGLFGAQEKWKIILDADPYPDTISTGSTKVVTKSFQYMHGLPRSSSYGCKNILHGHLSFVRVAAKDKFYADSLALMISSYLDATYLFNKAHQVSPMAFEYTTDGRGFMALEFAPSFDLKLITMDREPTIENILDHVCDRFKDSIQPATCIMLSEGLQKGAIRRFS